MIKSTFLVDDCVTQFNASLAKIRGADSGGGLPPSFADAVFDIPKEKFALIIFALRSLDMSK